MRERLSSRAGIIPVDEDIRRLFQECKIGKGNASLLSEALAFAKPEDLKEKGIIKVCFPSPSNFFRAFLNTARSVYSGIL